MSGISKAIAGSIAGPLGVLVLYGLGQLPFVATLPPEPATALKTVVTALLGFGLVWIFPANRT